MAYFTATQADGFYAESAQPARGWPLLSTEQKGVLLEMASRRFDALPWRPTWITQSARVESVPI